MTLLLFCIGWPSNPNLDLLKAVTSNIKSTHYQIVFPCNEYCNDKRYLMKGTGRVYIDLSNFTHF